MSLLDQTVASVVAQDSGWRERARARLEQLVMPHWALGRLMDLAEDLAGMTRSLSPHFARRTIVVMAGDHGVAEEGVSLYPQEVTQQMVRSIAVGGASINHLAKVGGADLVVVDMGVSGDLTQLVDSGKVVSYNVGKGTGNIARGPAMTRDQAVQSLEHGIRIAREYGEATDLFGTGDMGIGNTTPSAAIAAAITQCSPEVVTGRGTGIDDIRLKEKALVVTRAIDVNNPDRTDPVDVLTKVGGFEIGGIAGLILGAASLSRPVVVDGFISTAGALLAVELAPAARDYIVAGHRSAEHGHDVMLAHLGKRPLLDLEMRLGEGTGAALAMPLVEAAGGLLSRVMTFEEASVSDRTELTPFLQSDCVPGTPQMSDPDPTGLVPWLRIQVRAFLASVMFLTRIPCPRWVGGDPDILSRATTYFPLIGCIVGMFGVLVYHAALLLWTPEVSSIAAVAATVWLTRAFHEDALADTFDGLGGGWTRDDMITIMKDSRMGAFGTVALILVVAVKLSALIAMPPKLVASALLVGHVLGRWSSLPLIRWMSYIQHSHAKSKPFAASVTGARLIAGSLIAFGVGAAVLEWRLLPVLGVVVLVVSLSARYLRRNLGGITGDTLGAVNQLAELAVYLVLAADVETLTSSL